MVNTESPYDQERQEMFELRKAISNQITAHRARYGVKDHGYGDINASKQNLLFWQIENQLREAISNIFVAEKLIFTLPKVSTVEKQITE